MRLNKGKGSNKIQRMKLKKMMRYKKKLMSAESNCSHINNQYIEIKLLTPFTLIESSLLAKNFLLIQINFHNQTLHGHYFFKKNH